MFCGDLNPIIGRDRIIISNKQIALCAKCLDIRLQRESIPLVMCSCLLQGSAACRTGMRNSTLLKWAQNNNNNNNNNKQTGKAGGELS
jgi:hypothetical protein